MIGAWIAIIAVFQNGTPTKPKYLGAAGQEPIAIAGVGLGWTSGKIVGILGLPSTKVGGDLAENGSGFWHFGEDQSTLSIDFRNGKSISMFVDGPSVTMNIPGTGFKKIDLLEVLSDGISLDGQDKSIYFASGLEYEIGSDGRVKFLTYSFLNARIYQSEKSAMSAPDYHLTLLESSGYTIRDKDNWRNVHSATIKGIVQNNRKTPIDINVRGIWRSKYKDPKKTDFLNASDHVERNVKPGEKRIFTVVCDSFVVPREAEASVYEVELSEARK